MIQFNKDNLIEIEEDFIDFMSVRKNISYGGIRQQYLEIRNLFGFPSHSFTEYWCDKIHQLFKLEYTDNNINDLINSYKMHALLHLYENISLPYKSSIDYDNESNNIINISTVNKTIVDYGCGVGHLSFKIAKKLNSKVYLVDLDIIILDFAEFRFKKHNINYEVIKVNADNFYPELPSHDICICTEVLEHIPEHSKTINNVIKSMSKNGVLYGNFYDYAKEYMHVSPDLSDVRSIVFNNFKSVGNHCYVKI